MKPTAGYAKPRSIPASSRTRLNLQRRPKPEPEDDLEERQRSSFWKWVMLVALLHVLVIAGAYIYFLFAPAPKPPEQFISLLPPGDVVKGSVGAQQAHKLGANTPAAPSHHAAPPPPAPAHVAPTQPKTVTPPPVVKPPPPAPIAKTAPAPAPVKPKPTPPKPTTPPKPKVKIDLHEVERTDAAATETPPKPAKHHAKKPVKNPEDSQNEADSSPDNTGLTKQQIAEKLGEKMNTSGSHNAIKSGVSGAADGHQNPFGEFYRMIAEQVHDEWNSPMTPAENDPLVGIHVERDGRVPPESVHLIRSSGDPAYDEAAISTVKRLGYLHEPLPNGCPPDISVDFKPNP